MLSKKAVQEYEEDGDMDWEQFLALICALGTDNDADDEGKMMIGFS